MINVELGDTVICKCGYEGGTPTRKNTKDCFEFVVTEITEGFLYNRLQKVYGVNPAKVKVVKSIKHTHKINSPVKSDGGSSSYYDLQLSGKTIEFIKENGFVKTEHLIMDIFGNNFDFGNALKSLVRAYGIVQGGGKEGNDIKYETNKIKYSCDKLVEYNSKE